MAPQFRYHPYFEPHTRCHCPLPPPNALPCCPSESTTYRRADPKQRAAPNDPRRRKPDQSALPTRLSPALLAQTECPAANAREAHPEAAPRRIRHSPPKLPPQQCRPQRRRQPPRQRQRPANQSISGQPNCSCWTPTSCCMTQCACFASKNTTFFCP